MPNAENFSRNYLILGVCLPLAVLVGYLMAEPLQSSSLAVVLLLFSTLSIPLLMRWYQPLLILSWNACVSPYFLPGRPYAWMLMALVSCLFALLARATQANRRFLSVPPMTWSLLCVGLVVGVTVIFNGGLGMNALGSNVYGGKYYLYILLAIIGYFVFTSQRVASEHADLYVAFFFLSGTTAVISNLVYLAGPKFYDLYYLFPPDFAMSQAQADSSLDQMAVRIAGLGTFSVAVWCFMLARYGIHGVLDFSKPWRGVVFLLTIGAGLLGGFRSSVIFFLLVFAVVFCLERLWRTRLLVIILLFGALTGAGLALFVDKMPLSAQRAVSFLPINVDPIVRQDAYNSLEWRLDMWRKLLPEVPQYLLKGKGYSINPKDLYLMEESVARGYMSTADIATLAGDYHNGPLSILIPFGIWGVIGFGWFFIAGWGVLYRNFRFGTPELQRINNFLLALFIARIITFLFIFGAIYLDLAYFIGLIGFSVALNGGVNSVDQSLTVREVDV